MTQRDRPRPVFDPAIGAADRALLTAAPRRLVPACRPAPPPPRLRPAVIAARLVWVPAFALFYGVLPGGWLRFLFLASLDENELVGGPARWGRAPTLAMMLTPVLQIALLLLGQVQAAAALAALSFAGWAAAALRRLREPAAARAAREHHGSYLLAADFDRPAAGLLVRAQCAIDAVLASRAHRAGLLDPVRDTVVLLWQEWAIAGALAEHTRLRRERGAQRPERLSPHVRSLLEPQDGVLERSIQSVAGRVEALEAYARRAGAVDAAYHEARVLAALPAQNARYRDLLASTAADELACAEIGELIGEARRAETTLRAGSAGMPRDGGTGAQREGDTGAQREGDTDAQRDGGTGAPRAGGGPDEPGGRAVSSPPAR